MRGTGRIEAEMVVRILLADDHVIVRRGLRALLETQPDLVCQTRQGRIEPQLYRGCDLVDVLSARS